MISKRAILFIILYGITFTVYSQVDSYYIFSNLESKIDIDLLELYTNDVKETIHQPKIISLGDNHLQSIQTLKRKSNKCEVLLLTGDRDLIQLNSIKKIIQQKGYKSLTNGNFCPQPKVYEVNDMNVIIAYNTNWFLSRDVQQKAKDQDCKVFNEENFYEELESLIEENASKNIVLLSHHTLASNSSLNGKNLWRYDLIPFIGNLYASYRRHIGNKNDMVSDKYKRYLKNVKSITTKSNIIAITGHDFVTSNYKQNNTNYININSGNKNYRLNEGTKDALYQSNLPSYIKLNYNDNYSEIIFVNSVKNDTLRINSPKQKTLQKIESNSPTVPLKDSIAVVASSKYKNTKLRKILMGSGYRKAWSTPVKAPYLHLKNKNLIPYERGGGLQTKSIKLNGENRKKYAFRTLDKEPEKSLNEILRKSIYRNVIQELITTMHPYAPLVAHELIKETNILHIKPELYVMSPNQPLMNGYEEFDNKIGTLEEKPKGKKKERKGYMDADKIVSSFQLLSKLISNSEHRIDKMAYARARVFDMYIGDWDRHEDNWKWAMVKENKKRKYIPIPKDRDHVFSKWTGLIPRVTDYFIPNAENFGSNFGNLKQLNFKAYHLDRQLGSELTSQDWQNAAEYIKSTMTDTIINSAIQAFPKEVREFYANEITEKLKSRKKDLNRAVNEHYNNISQQVDVVGTNEKDLFEIVRKSDGAVLVNVYNTNKSYEKKSLFYTRKFDRETTDKIYCYGLNSKDYFNISGISDESIKVYIVGGDDTDIIYDVSKVKKQKKYTVVYDSSNGDSTYSRYNTLKIKKPKRKAYYEPYARNQNNSFLIPSIRNSSGNGWGADISLNYIIQGYNKPNYAHQLKTNLRYFPEIGAYRIGANYQYRHLLGLQDFVARLSVSDEYDIFPFYYGIGSLTEFDNEAREDGRYRIDYDYARLEAGLSRIFYQKSIYETTIFSEYHRIEAEKRSQININELPDKQFFIGLKSELNIDFTDRTKYPTDGNKLMSKIEARLSDTSIATANFTTELSYYKTINTGFCTTLAVKFGGQASLGDANFYHLSSLGSNVGLRGYTRNRFLDKNAAYYNTELRWKLGTLYTPLIQMEVGTFLLHDSGKVWNETLTFSNSEWKKSFGVGIFIAPYSTDYAITYALIRSDDNFLYSQFQLGFSF